MTSYSRHGLNREHLVLNHFSNTVKLVISNRVVLTHDQNSIYQPNSYHNPSGQID
jgi:hypothetical protein